MKTLLSILLFSTLLFTDPEPVVEWLSPTEYDFGVLDSTEEVYTEFEVRNISGEPILIDNVRPGCGCTVPDWPEGAIAPDSVFTLKVWYNPKGPGYFREKIKVYFNLQRKAEILYIEGEVIQ